MINTLKKQAKIVYVDKSYSPGAVQSAMKKETKNAKVQKSEK